MKPKYVIVAVLLCAVAVFGQESKENQAPKQAQLDTSQRYLVLDTFKTSTLQRELDEAAAAGYRVVHGDTRHNILILEKTADRYQYRVLQNMKKDFDPAVADSWGAVPATFSSEAGKAAALIMEKPAQGAAKHDYLVLDTVRTKTLQKELNEAAAKGYEFIAMSTYGPNSALLEKRSADAPSVPDRYLLLATTRTSTMQKEINDAVAKGYAIAAGSGGDELMVILEKSTAKPDYLLLATARSTTLEKEINEAAARGFRPLPRTLLALNKQHSFSLSLTANETCIVMEKVPQPENFTYRIIGTSRVGTFKKELAQAAAEGFELIGFTLTYTEQLALVRKAAPATGAAR